MKIEILFCKRNNKLTAGGFYSWVINVLGFISGYRLKYIHAAILVDLSDIDGFTTIYEMTMGGIADCDAEDWTEWDTVAERLVLNYDKNNPEKVHYIGEVLDRIEHAQIADLKGDWADLLRIFFHRPTMNLTCVGFVRYALGLGKDDDVVTVDDLYQNIIEEETNDEC